MNEETNEPKLADDIVLKEGVTQPDKHLNLPFPSEPSPSFTPEVDRKQATKQVYNNYNRFSVPAKHGVFVCICSALICSVLAAATALACFCSAYAWPWQMEWPAVEGRITSITAYPKSARFDYSYDVDGKYYYSGEIRSGTFQHTLRPRQKITVRHHPRYLNLSVMQAGFNIVETPLLILVTLGLLFASWMFASMRLIEREPSSSSAAEPSPERR